MKKNKKKKLKKLAAITTTAGNKLKKSKFTLKKLKKAGVPITAFICNVGVAHSTLMKADTGHPLMRRTAKKIDEGMKNMGIR